MTMRGGRGKTVLCSASVAQAPQARASVQRSTMRAASGGSNTELVATVSPARSVAPAAKRARRCRTMVIATHMRPMDTTNVVSAGKVTETTFTSRSPMRRMTADPTESAAAAAAILNAAARGSRGRGRAKEYAATTMATATETMTIPTDNSSMIPRDPRLGTLLGDPAPFKSPRLPCAILLRGVPVPGRMERRAARGARRTREVPMADDEMWDVTDIQGAPTGTLHRRGDGPVPAGSFHIVASVCLVSSSGRVLMSLRAAGKDYPLAWEFPAGSALRGETSRTGAVRELAEETGMVRAPDDLVLVGRVVEERALFDLWVARIEGEPVPVPDPEEVQDAEWVTLDVVHQRWQDGVFAMPWNGRFDQLWETLEQRVAEMRDRVDGA
ncbi:hypothetical protein C1632_10810 [Microbacterium testaceum]|nr:hypothetical protein C1632_10810 [Microbacterium testaceum]